MPRRPYPLTSPSSLDGVVPSTSRSVRGVRAGASRRRPRAVSRSRCGARRTSTRRCERGPIPAVAAADCAIVPGIDGPSAPFRALYRGPPACRRARRVVDMLGAFVLAAAGLLDGSARRPLLAADLAPLPGDRRRSERPRRRRPDPDLGGAAAGLDLPPHGALRPGAAVAAAGARLAVMPLERAGGQHIRRARGPDGRRRTAAPLARCAPPDAAARPHRPRGRREARVSAAVSRADQDYAGAVDRRVRRASICWR